MKNKRVIFLFVLFIIILFLPSIVNASSIANIEVSGTTKLNNDFMVTLSLPSNAYGAQADVIIKYGDNQVDSKKIVYMNGMNEYKNSVTFKAKYPGNTEIRVCNIVISDSDGKALENGGEVVKNIFISDDGVLSLNRNKITIHAGDNFEFEALMDNSRIPVNKLTWKLESVQGNIQNVSLANVSENNKRTLNASTLAEEGKYILKVQDTENREASCEITVIKFTESKIFKAQLGSTVSNVLTQKNFSKLGTTGYEFYIVSGNGAQKESNEKVFSKDTIIVKYNDNKIEEYKIAIKGDVSGNGKIELYDIFILLKGILKENITGELDKYICDFNNDGTNNMKDAFELVRYALK